VGKLVNVLSKIPEVLVGISDLGMRLFIDYGPSHANNEFVLLCGKPGNFLMGYLFTQADIGIVSLTSVQRIETPNGNEEQVFLLEGLQPQRYYYAGNERNSRSSAYSFSAVKVFISVCPF
jgi:hypothetical protein